MKAKILSAVAILVILGGCAINVPKNSLSVKAPNGSVWTLDTPKDNMVEKLELVIETNKFTFKADKIVATNSPAVIDRTAAGEVAKITAMGNAVVEGIKAAATAKP